MDTERIFPPGPYAYLQIPPYTGNPSTPASQPRSSAPTAVSSLTEKFGAIFNTSIASTTPSPITSSAFAPFGQLIQPQPGTTGNDVQPAPDGLHVKYARLADISHTYPADSGAVTGISVFRASPKIGLERGKVFEIRLMERHEFTTQAFIPMGKGTVSCYSDVADV
jgi:allantoicase